MADTAMWAHVACDFGDDADRIAELLHEAARLWVRTQPPHDDRATSGNQFLWVAERAWSRAADGCTDARAFYLNPASLPLQAWGVYHLIGDGGRVLYVGMSGAPRARVRHHIDEFGDHVRGVMWHPVIGRVSALRLEANDIARLHPPLNVAGQR